jgi:hypothetical protein
LNSVGAGQVQLYDQVKLILDNLKTGADKLAGQLSGVAFATIGVFGNLLFIFFLSLYMAVDRDHIESFLLRLVPPRYAEEARLLEHSVARSFGGFLRGQAFTGVIYGLISACASLALGLPFTPVTAASSGILQAIPFFGPFISWVPPVLVAVFFKPEADLPDLIIMIVGWFIVMNIIQPRLVSEAVGLRGGRLARPTGSKVAASRRVFPPRRGRHRRLLLLRRTTPARLPAGGGQATRRREARGRVASRDRRSRTGSRRRVAPAQSDEAAAPRSAASSLTWRGGSGLGNQNQVGGDAGERRLVDARAADCALAPGVGADREATRDRVELPLIGEAGRAQRAGARRRADVAPCTCPP